MKDSFLDRATDLVRLASTIRSGLESAERTIPEINDHLADLAAVVMPGGIGAAIWGLTEYHCLTFAPRPLTPALKPPRAYQTGGLGFASPPPPAARSSG
jgi:hypothetical protein